MELATGAAAAVFDGRIDGNSLAGTFTQGNASGTFLLTRGVELTAAPTPPPPYREEEVRVSNGDITLAGTLTIPAGGGPFPAVVLITGSGPQDRDEDIFGFKVFRTIADHLTRQGVSVYRYDDRGVGSSTGSLNVATTADFAGDALAAVGMLRSRPDIDARRVGLLGHSEGATVAAIAAFRSADVAFVVTLASPGVRGDEVLRQQAADGARALGAGEEVVARIVAAHRQATDAVRMGQSAESLASVVMELVGAQYDSFPAAQRAAAGDRDAFVARTYRAGVAQLGTPWMRFMLDFDPAVALRLVRCPVLALFGSLDTQVVPSPNQANVRAALAGNADATVKSYDGANHLFQQARTGLVTEYATLEKAFVPGLLDDLSAWIRLVTGR